MTPTLGLVKPGQKLWAWAAVLLAVYALRNVFDIVFMTFIMSYLALQVVGRLAGDREGAGLESRLRRPVVVLVYLTALAVSYLFIQAIVPRAIEQGRWLLDQVARIDPQRITDDLLARTLGRVEFARFRRGPDYTQALAEFKAGRFRHMTFEDLKATARQIRAAFEDLIVDEQARVALDRLRSTGDLDELYRQWLAHDRAERELTAKPELLRRLDDEFDAGYRLVNGEDALVRDKDTKAYQDRRRSVAIGRATAQMHSAGLHRQEAERAIGRARGRDLVAAMPTLERETRFREFYQREVPRLFPGFRHGYEGLVSIEGAASQAELGRRLGTGAAGEGSAEEAFAGWMERQLAGKHPLAALLKDAPEMARAQIPTVTGWLTRIINYVLAFGLNALFSLVLSFMIVWEVPQMRRGMEGVRGTRAEAVLAAVGPDLARLASVIGLAFSAQMVIAAINALLAYLALLVIGMASPLFLSLIVFFCSLVPYVGVFFAAVPILLVALQQGGLSMLVHAALCLLAIHELEAWVLWPRVLAGFLQLSAVTIIFILCVAQPLFGVWGLLLGVPVTVFVIRDLLLEPLASPVPAGPGPTP